MSKQNTGKIQGSVLVVGGGIAGMQSALDMDLCTGCGACVENCPVVQQSA